MLPLCQYFYGEKQPSEVFCKKGILRNLAKFTGKHLFFNKVAGLKKRLWHRCFPVNFARFLSTPFLQNTLRRLLLYGPLSMRLRRLFYVHRISILLTEIHLSIKLNLNSNIYCKQIVSYAYTLKKFVET